MFELLDHTTIGSNNGLSPVKGINNSSDLHNHGQPFLIHFMWRHQMETFSALLAICAGNSPVPGEFLTQRPVTRSLMVSLICVWINGWVNNREAGDLRRYRAHYDATNMEYEMIKKTKQNKTWFEADIPHINLTPNRYNALAPTIA